MLGERRALFGAETNQVSEILHAALPGKVLMPSYKKPPAKGEPLTNRESEAAQRLTEGYSNKVIASMMDISEHTAKFYVTCIVLKLGARTRTDAAVKFARMVDALAFAKHTQDVHDRWLRHSNELAAHLVAP